MHIPKAASPVKSQTDKPLNIVIVGSEMTGVAGSGGLGDIIRVLPEELTKAGYNVLSVIPFYKQQIVPEVASRGRLVVTEIRIPMNHTQGYWEEKAAACVVKVNDVNTLLIKNDDYFNRYAEKGALYGPREDEAWPDNDLRYIFLNKAVFEAVRNIGFKPDIIHAHDWQAGLIPVYLHVFYKNDPFFKGTATAYTIHNYGLLGYSRIALFIELAYRKITLILMGLSLKEDGVLQKLVYITQIRLVRSVRPM